MGEVDAATTVTNWWIGVMLKQLWRSAPWQRVQRLLVTIWLFLVARLGITFGFFLTLLVSVYITQSTAMRFGCKKPGKPPRPKTGGPVRGWWTPYIFVYDRLTNLVKMSEEIRMGLKGILAKNQVVRRRAGRT
eukprot:5606295-Ditylum_brightwellii.AAC.1